MDNNENNGQNKKPTFDRPLKVDKDSYDEFTVSRMTDHNVRGSDTGSTTDSGPREVDDRFSKLRSKKNQK